MVGVSTPARTPDRAARRAAARRRQRDAQLAQAVRRLRRRHPHVFEALVTIIARADEETLEAVAVLLKFTLSGEATDLAPAAREGRARTRRA